MPSAARGSDELSFFWPEGRSPATWTGFRRSSPESPRPIEDVSLIEIGNAMQALCRAGGGMEREELLREALAVFGGRRLTPAIRQRMDTALDRSLANERLVASAELVLALGQES